jgi:release factor glutamine methyltransferase
MRPVYGTMTVQAALTKGIGMLKDAGVEGHIRDARLLMACSLGIGVERLTLHDTSKLLDMQEASFFDAVRGRMARRPMSHLLGRRDFYGRRFTVTPDVLDPRGDTETLVEAALEVPFKTFLDLGTGSGCILVTLLAERKDARGIGTDVCRRAMKIARMNAQVLGVARQCAIESSDWFGSVEGTFDLIVSNPPYIAADEMDELAEELSFEPRMALTDEGDGLSCYRIITAGAGAHLNAGGWLMVEIGPTQGAAVVAMFEDAGLHNIAIRPDLDGRDRVVVGQKTL